MTEISDTATSVAAPESEEEFAARMLSQQVALQVHRLAADLRGLAEAIERQANAASEVCERGLETHVAVAARVQETILSRLGGLNLGTLTVTAHHADTARERAQGSSGA